MIVVIRSCLVVEVTAVAPSAVIALNVGMLTPAGRIILYANVVGANPSILILFARISLSKAVERSFRMFIATVYPCFVYPSGAVT